MKGIELLIENLFTMKILGLDCFIGKLIQRIETKHDHVSEIRGNIYPLMS